MSDTTPPPGARLPARPRLACTRLACTLMLAAPLLLAGCARSADDTYPHLLPFEQVLADPVLPASVAADPDKVTRELADKGAALDARAAALQAARPAGGETSARAASLRDRASAIRADVTPDAETTALPLGGD